MTQLNHGRAARLALVLLGVCLGVGAAPQPKLAAAPPEAIAVNSDGNRLWVSSPYLHLEFDLRRPALDVLQVAPWGDGQLGASLGWVTEEASIQGRRLLSMTDDPDGARVSWTSRPEGVVIRLEGIDVGGSATSSWTVTVPQDDALLRIERLTSLRGNLPVDSVGLAVISPAVPEGVDPASLARMLNSGVYRPEIGPITLEQPGWMLGLLAVDNPELTFSARSEQPDRVVVRQEGYFTSLSFVHRLAPPRQSGNIQESIVFRFGWDNDYLVARSNVDPSTESRLLGSGYFGNAVISPSLGTVLSASMRDYRGSVWSRDTDYALQGYSYVLSDMSVFRNTLQNLLERVDEDGIAPEFLLLDGRHGNRESWDSMANVIQATYTFVSKTGDLDFYRRNEAALKRAANWIRALDTDDDGLPDVDIFPYGYTDTVENGPMHTYAIAKFYGAFLALADLDEASGKDGHSWRSYAAVMQESFSLPLSSGGYWNPETGYPIAWKRDNGQVYTNFETFGVFEAIRAGLLHDESQLRSVANWLVANRAAFLNGHDYPERLMVGGYDLSVKKAEVPLDKLWIMDSNAPWIIGLSVPARVRLGLAAEAREMFGFYASSADRSTPHAEFGAGPLARYGPGETFDGGRLWDNWAWFSVVYGTHFGLRMTPWALEVAPAPLDSLSGRYLSDVIYQGARLEMQLLDDGYRVKLTAPRQLVLRPPLGYGAVDVNGDGNFQPVRELMAAPGVPYLIRAYK